MSGIAVSGSFNDINSRTFRFLQEASKLGPVRVLLWSDELAERLDGARPKFSLAERRYVMDALRYVDTVTVVERLESLDALPAGIDSGLTWVVDQAADCAAKRTFCNRHGLQYQVVPDDDLAGYPGRETDPLDRGRKTIIVTGCYDWFHSGHVRFFEEVSEHGNLYVVVGHDANILLLKGEGHPMFPEAERRYMAQSIRFVNQAFVSTGHGWMDAEPEIARLRPDAYAVNEDGDVPEKREFCEKHGLEYIVLKREPKPGLTRRTSTDLRGF
jgi:cytidyltransferase-like protein